MSSNESSSSNSSAFDNGEGEPQVSYAMAAAEAGINPDFWHQDLELIFICVCSFLTILLICVRTWIRRRNSKKFRADDYWMIAAGALMIPYLICQVMTNRNGSGQHFEILPNPEQALFLAFERGWAAYYLITSIIKIAQCALLLEILPPRFDKAKICVYMLCGCIMSLGLALTLVWLFQCMPIASNFDWNVIATDCVDFGAPRYAWVGLGIVFDICITGIPLTLLTKMMLKSNERKILKIIFSANLLGTVILVIGIYGIWFTSNEEAFPDYTYEETVYIIMQNLETLAYTIGASAPVFSRYFVRKSPNRSQDALVQWRLRNYNPSDFSGQPGKSSAATTPSSYQEERGGSFFSRPPPSYVSLGSDSRKGSLCKDIPESPGEDNRSRKGSLWKSPIHGHF